MEHRKSTFRLLLPTLGVWLVSLVLTQTSAKEIPEGIPAGRWILVPLFAATYEADSNLFRESEGPDDTVRDDRIATLIGELFGAMPFRNSQLTLGYRATKESYENTTFPNDLAQLAHFDLELNFKSGDRLAFRDIFREDYTRSEDIDSSGDTSCAPTCETVFEGQPYRINRWEVVLSRDDPRRQGYYVRVRRVDFNYYGDQFVGFFDYRGFDNVFEYRQPLPAKRSWVLRYNPRRFDYYDPNCKLPDEECDGGVGVAIRKEVSDSVEIGLMGNLGDRQPYVVRLGYTSFRYEGTRSSDYNGIVGNAAWRLVLGDRTDLELRLHRRALPSNFETYYINNAARARLKRDWLRFEVGADLRYDLNVYGDPIFVGNMAGEQLFCQRRDSTYKLDVDWAWRLHERFKFGVSAFHTNRRSTCENGDYQATGLGTGIALGW